VRQGDRQSIRLSGRKEIYMSLTDTQRRLHNEVLELSGWDGADTRDVLADVSADLDDKVAVAEVLGGEGAGEAYRQEIGR
jgi:hypothetical protein